MGDTPKRKPGRPKTSVSQKLSAIHSNTPQGPAKRQDWERYHALIVDCYLRLFAEKKRPPSQTEIGIACGLSRDTVGNHIRGLKLEDYLPDVKLRTMRVLHGLTQRAEQGYAAEVKLWMQLVYDWTERQDITSGGEPITAIEVTIRKK
jgi:hypothetical protein